MLCHLVPDVGALDTDRERSAISRQVRSYAYGTRPLSHHQYITEESPGERRMSQVEQPSIGFTVRVDRHPRIGSYSSRYNGRESGNSDIGFRGGNSRLG